VDKGVYEAAVAVLDHRPPIEGSRESRSTPTYSVPMDAI
jgi:hypothetical protein